jgi:hypothetical protein
LRLRTSRKSIRKVTMASVVSFGVSAITKVAHLLLVAHAGKILPAWGYFSSGVSRESVLSHKRKYHDNKTKRPHHQKPHGGYWGENRKVGKR